MNTAQRFTEKSRVLARYGPETYREMFGTKRKPSKKMLQRARALWGTPVTKRKSK